MESVIPKALSARPARFSPLTQEGRFGLLLALAIGFATGGGLMLWKGEDGNRILSAGLEAGDIASAVRELQAHGIPLRVDDAGVIRVPAQQLSEARLLLGGVLWPAEGPEAPGSSSRPGTDIRRLERDYAARIERLLTPLVGPGQVRADVSVDLGPAQRDDRTGTSVDGADPNERPVARLRRLSVAVVIGDRLLGRDGAGREVLAPGELDRITALIKDVVGFSEARGDRLSIVNAPFAAGPREPHTAYASLTRPAAGWILLAGGLLFFLLALRGHARRGSNSVEKTPPSTGPAPATGSSEAPVPSGPTDSQETDARPALDEQLGVLRAFAGQDPKRIAQVVKRWMAEDERG